MYCYKKKRLYVEILEFEKFLVILLERVFPFHSEVIDSIKSYHKREI